MAGIRTETPMQNNALIRRVFALVAIASGTVAYAQVPALSPSSTPSFSIRGFGTIGTAHSSIERGDFVANTRQSSGTGFSHEWAWGVDSKLGIQLDARLSEQFSAVVQVVSRQDPDNTYTPEAEWLNLKYQPHPDFSIRAGRILLPTLMTAESRLVDYANPWIRPPVETYSLVELTRSDGIDASYRRRIGNATNTVQLLFGRQNEDLVLSLPYRTNVLEVRVRNLIGITNTIESGAWTMRAAAFTAKVSIGPVDGFSGGGRVNFYNLGAMREGKRWFVQGEWTILNSQTKVRGASTQRRTAYYLSSGYRWGKLTPYAVYSWTGPTHGPPSPSSRSLQQKTVSAGVRWDVARNVALKAQFDRIRLGRGGGGNGYFTNLQPGFPLAGSGNVVSVSANFIF